MECYNGSFVGKSELFYGVDLTMGDGVDGRRAFYKRNSERCDMKLLVQDASV